MKRIISLSLVVLLMLTAAQAAVATTPATSGHLVIKRSPTLGRNLSITIKIDGKVAGLLSWGRTFETDLAPGRHELVAEASKSSGTWRTTLDVRPHQTYSYTANYSSGHLKLQ